MNRGLSVLRRIRRECPWGMLASLFGSRTRDSSERPGYSGNGELVMASGKIVAFL